jgi:hypothetical protein
MGLFEMNKMTTAERNSMQSMELIGELTLVFLPQSIEYCWRPRQIPLWVSNLQPAPFGRRHNDRRHRG